MARKVIWPMALSPGGRLQIVQYTHETHNTELTAECGLCSFKLRLELQETGPALWRCHNCRERFDWVGLTSSGASKLVMSRTWNAPSVIETWMRQWIGVEGLDLRVSIDE